MLVSELAPALLLMRALIAAALVPLGAADRAIGVAGVWLFAPSEVGRLVLMWRNVRGARALGPAPPLRTIARTKERFPDGVAHQIEIPYWETLTLDIHAGSDLEEAPCRVYVHPGSWMRGRP